MSAAPPDDAPSRDRGNGRRNARPAMETGNAFDLWLKRGLEELYSEALRGPISQDLLDIIGQDDRSRGAGGR